MKIFRWFFMTLGVIFFIIILAVGYLVIVDPFEIRPLISSFMGEEETVDSTDEDTSTEQSAEDKHPYLSAEQEATIESFGIDPASLPQEISPKMEACAEEKLGAERTAEIKSGDTPTISDYIKARACL